MQYVKKLMEEIPNKVRDMMGILVDVNLKEKDEKSYLEIVTEAYPIIHEGLRQSEKREGTAQIKKQPTVWLTA